MSIGEIVAMCLFIIVFNYVFISVLDHSSFSKRIRILMAIPPFGIIAFACIGVWILGSAIAMLITSVKKFIKGEDE
jgi:hypothetical protein